ncbi:MAG TPA: hypothetical protein VIV60_13925 [Polyangiaceae bacterium]
MLDDEGDWTDPDGSGGFYGSTTQTAPTSARGGTYSSTNAPGMGSIPSATTWVGVGGWRPITTWVPTGGYYNTSYPRTTPRGGGSSKGGATYWTSSVSYGGRPRTVLPVGGYVARGGTTGVGGSRPMSVGGTRATGGWSAAGGTRATGGWSAAGGRRATGGWSAAGGMRATGGWSPAAGGVRATGGSSFGGRPAMGGFSGFGGVSWAGRPSFGGRPAMGGASSLGGMSGILSTIIAACNSAPNECQRCECLVCAPRAADCAGDMGCLLLVDCASRNNCSSLDCFVPGGPCQSIVNIVGGLQSSSVSRAVALALCPMTSNCGC